MVTGQYNLYNHCKVFIDGIPLRLGPSKQYLGAKTYGFRWGIPCEGATQLSFALLLHFCGAEDAMKYYQIFNNDVVAYIPLEKDHQMVLFDSDIRNFVARKKAVRNKWGRLFWKLFSKFYFTQEFYETYVKPNIQYEDWWSLRPSIYFALDGKLAREGW